MRLLYIGGNALGYLTERTLDAGNICEGKTLLSPKHQPIKERLNMCVCMCDNKGKDSSILLGVFMCVLCQMCLRIYNKPISKQILPSKFFFYVLDFCFFFFALESQKIRSEVQQREEA